MNLQELLIILNKKYTLKLDKIELLRDGPGFVCLVSNDDKKYIIKMYRSSIVEIGIQSVEVMTFLYSNGYRVPKIIPTLENQEYFFLDTPEGKRIGVMYEYIEGIDPYEILDVEKIGRQTGEMHNIMQNYQGSLLQQDRAYFIEHYINKLHGMGYPEKKIERFKEHGNMLWKRVQKLPKGFCHGDLHTGNLLQTSSEDYTVLDFDFAAHSFPVFDAMTICDRTDYFNFNADGYDKVTRMIDGFFRGYTKVCNISKKEVGAIYDLIGVRHYQLQAQIIDVYGLDCVDEAFIDNQYEWLMKWENQCERKRRE